MYKPDRTIHGNGGGRHVDLWDLIRILHQSPKLPRAKCPEAWGREGWVGRIPVNQGQTTLAGYNVFLIVGRTLESTLTLTLHPWSKSK